MERTREKLELISSSAEITVDFRDASLVCVEYEAVCGFLISRTLSKDESTSSLFLGDCLYLHGNGSTFGLSPHGKIILSNSDHFWSATDADTIEIISRPSLTPYPLIAISTHGFEWFREQVAKSALKTVWEHLVARFENTEPPQSLHVSEIRLTQESGE